MPLGIRIACVLSVLACADFASAQLQPELGPKLEAAFKSGLDLRRQNKPLEAIAAFQKAAELAPKVFGPEHINTAGILSTLAASHLDVRKPDEAEPLLRRSLAIREKLLGKDHFELHVVLHNLAIACGQQEKLEEHESLLRRSLALQEAKLGTEHPDLLPTRTHMVQALQKRGKHVEAIEFSRGILRLLEKTKGGEHPDVADALQTLATSLHSARQTAEAEASLRRAIGILEKTDKKDVRSARALSRLGILVRSTGRLKEAEEILRRSLEACEAAAGKDHPETARHLFVLGESLMDARNYEEADRVLRRSMAIFEAKLGSNHPDVAFCLSEIGAIHDHLGQHTEAEAACRRALKIVATSLGEGHFQNAVIGNRLAGFLLAQGRYPEAEALFQSCLKRHREIFGPESNSVATVLSNLAQAQKSQGRIEEAEQSYFESLRIQEKRFGKDHPTQEAILCNLGTLSLARGRYKDAEGYLRRSLALNDKARGRTVDAAVMLEGLAIASHLTHDSGQAIRYQAESLQVHRKHLDNILAFTSESALQDYLSSISHRLPVLVNLARSQPESEAARTEAFDWTLRFKGIALEASCRYRQAQFALGADSPLTRQAAEYRAIKQKLADAALHPLTDDKGQLAVWQKASLELEAELKRALSRQMRSVSDAEAVTARAVRERLSPGAALVEFTRVPIFDFKAGAWSTPHYFAFVVRAGQDAPTFIDLGEEKAIHRAVVAVREEITSFQAKLGECEDAEEMQSLEKAQEPLFKKVGAAAHGKILAPLAKALGDAELIYLAPDADLNRLPFGALVDASGKYVAESRRFAYLSSGRDLLRTAPPPAKGTLVFAGPDYKVGAAERLALAEKMLAKPQAVAALRGQRAGDLRSVGWKALPGAAAEAKDIRAALEGSGFGPVKTLQGAEAIEEALKAMPAPRVLHLATHGFFLDHESDAAPVVDHAAGAGGARSRLKRTGNPLLRSGIVLAGANTIGDNDEADRRADDGWVTAEEIALLNLRGTELVVLSACQTGLGDVRTGEGVFGLRRAFLYAGAQTLVTSLFEVPDTETRELMQHFYKRLKDGESKLSALHSAQRELLGQRRRMQQAAHPFFWASFVLVGDPK